jgi:hypothetical protein
MRNIILTLSLLVITAVAAFGQTDQTNVYGFGIAWDQSASNITSQQYAVTAMYARAQTEKGTYAFTALDIVPTSVKPVTVTTQTSVGVAQRVLTLNGWNFYATGATGPSWSGTNAGWAWIMGGMATHSIGKTGWKVMPNIRTIKSSINNNSGYQLIFGCMFGFGN